MTRATFKDADRDISVKYKGFDIDIYAHGAISVNGYGADAATITTYITYGSRSLIEDAGITGLPSTRRKEIAVHRLQSSRTLNTTGWKSGARKEPSLQRLIERLVLDEAQTMLVLATVAIDVGPDKHHDTDKYIEAVKGGAAIRAALVAAQS